MNRNWYEEYSPKELVPYIADGEYEQEAVDFAQRNGVKLYVLAKDYGLYFPDDRNERWIYKMQIVRGKKSYTFTFGQSIAAGDTVPSYYDVLAAFTKYDPYDFESFCADYGYDPDSRKAYSTFKAVQKEYNAVSRLFGDVMEDLEEIQGIGATHGILVGKILSVEYRNTSYYGNNSYWVYMDTDKGFVRAYTAANASLGYTIESMEGKTVGFNYTKRKDGGVVLHQVADGWDYYGNRK